MKYFIKLFLVSILLLTLPLPSFAKKVTFTLISCLKKDISLITIGASGRCFFQHGYLVAKKVSRSGRRLWRLTKGCEYSVGGWNLKRIFYIKMTHDKTFYLKKRKSVVGRKKFVLSRHPC